MKFFSEGCATRWLIAVLAAVPLLATPGFAAVSASAGWAPKLSQPAAASSFCASYRIAGAVSAAGNTNGALGTLTEGETFTFTATGAGTGTWRVVGDGGGVTTLLAGGTFPGTLSYTFHAPQIGPGVGFFVDSYTGTGDTITASCSAAPVPVPTLAEWSQIALVLLVGLLGLAAIRQRRSR